MHEKHSTLPGAESAATECGSTQAGARGRIGAYLALAKARLSALVVMTTLAGFLLASEGAAGHAGWWRLIWTLIGTALAAGGANALNQWMERRVDARMERTRGRPLPAGQLSPQQALRWAVTVSLAGVLILALFVNLLTASLALFVILLYLLVYTPLKARSPLCTIVGAVCGAVPPMMGFTAVTGQLSPGAWILGAILFIWQIPHFLSLAILYRDDYARGGLRMLPVVEHSCRSTCRMIVLYSLALIPAGLALTLSGHAGWIYAVGSIVLGSAMVAGALNLYFQRTRHNARRLFFASLAYLPLLLILMAANPGPPAPAMAGGSMVQAEISSEEWWGEPLDGRPTSGR
ncbi:protoheme IX farnesyltransferase [bacterium]|nr:protoheme IX farnesyltransferase [bacterium]